LFCYPFARFWFHQKSAFARWSEKGLSLGRQSVKLYQPSSAAVVSGASTSMCRHGVR
jgi:hypothetical protein